LVTRTWGRPATPEPKTWESVYLQKYGSEPTVKPLDMKAVNFIIEQVMQNPNEITIIAIGTCVNLATAVAYSTRDRSAYQAGDLHGRLFL